MARKSAARIRKRDDRISHNQASAGKIRKDARHLFYMYSTQLRNLHDGDEVLLGGIISKAKFTTTRKTNEKMAIVTLEDLNGVVDCLVFPSTFAKCGGLIKQDAIIFIKGRVSLREEEPKIVASEIVTLDSVRAKYTKAVM